MDVNELSNLIERDRNERLDTATSIEVFAHHMRLLTLQFTGEDFSVSTHDRDQLHSLHMRVVSHLDDQFAKLEVMCSVRAQNLQKYREIEFVSLGLDCLSRTVATRWGLKKYARLGESTQPFDLSVHPPLVIEELVNSEFSGYLDTRNLSFISELNFCTNTALGVNFNHETGRTYADDDFKQLRAVYERRISNFWRVIEGDLPICFIVHIPVFMPAQEEHADSLYRTLQTLRQRARSRIAMIVINTFASGSIQQPRQLMRDDFRWINEALPFDGYVWHLPEHFMTNEGIAFERRLVEEISVLADELLH